MNRDEVAVFNPDDPIPGADALFVDRISESEALAASLRQHRSQMYQGTIDTDILRNVLVFYGEGGVGKTELSTQLAEWLGGKQARPQTWGRPPRPVHVIVRWDVNDSRGGLDPLPLLAELRAQLGGVKSEWSAFDLSFGALHNTVKPGEELRFRSPDGDRPLLTDLVQALLLDGAAANKRIKLPNSAGVAAFQMGRKLFKVAHERSKARQLQREYNDLEQLVDECESLSPSVENISKVAGRVAFMLTREVHKMSPPDRPTVVVFVDHMERLQEPGNTHLGEATLNRLISRLPYFLFVITGRNSLRWHEARLELDAYGPRRWPQLMTQHADAREPSQHLVGNLGPTDAKYFLSKSFETYGITAAHGLVDELANVTDGWPLHLQTIVALAREQNQTGRELTVEDLGGPLPALVDRLLRDLPPAAASAFRTACLLPYFDPSLVSTVGQVTEGDVARLVGRHLVKSNPDSTYPYRIHDSLRELVRSAGTDAVGGWAREDWRRHAGRALDEAKVRFERALVRCESTESGERKRGIKGAIETLALGLNVAAENETYDPGDGDSPAPDWLVLGIERSPNIWQLSSLVTAPAPEASQDVRDIADFLALRSKGQKEDVTQELRTIYDRKTAIAANAGLWRAYDLRRLGRYEEALKQLDDLVHDINDKPATYRMQRFTTMRLARRFRDALQELDSLSSSQQTTQHIALQSSHGHLGGSTERMAWRVEKAASVRFRVELRGEWVLCKHREQGISESEALQAHGEAVAAWHRSSQATCAGVLAEMNIFDEEKFVNYVDEMRDLSESNFQPFMVLPNALAMRALATGDEASAREARDIAASTSARSSSWIATEILLDHLGVPIDPVPTQWLDGESYETVRARFVECFERIIARVRAGSTAGR